MLLMVSECTNYGEEGLLCEKKPSEKKPEVFLIISWGAPRNGRGKLVLWQSDCSVAEFKGFCHLLLEQTLTQAFLEDDFGVIKSSLLSFSIQRGVLGTSFQNEEAI